MTTSEQLNEIAAAGAKAQRDLKHAVKDAKNPHFNSRYANEFALREASRVFAENGIAVWQGVVTAESGVEVTTLLTHSSGQWIKFDPFLVPLVKRDAHGVGSASTYAKRYALSAALGIAADDDDDGNAAVAAAGKAKNSRAVAAAPNPTAAQFTVGLRVADLVLSCDASGEKPWKATLVTVNGEQLDVTIFSEPVRNLAVDCAQDGSPVIATINKLKQLTNLKRWAAPKAEPTPEEQKAIDAEIAVRGRQA